VRTRASGRATASSISRKRASGSQWSEVSFPPKIRKRRERSDAVTASSMATPTVPSPKSRRFTAASTARASKVSTGSAGRTRIVSK
jgi:hypothetical protein